MAKTNKEAIMKLCNSINNKEGKGAIYSIDSEGADLHIKRWSTGIEDLDNILGGGMPEGRNFWSRKFWENYFVVSFV